MPPSPWFFVPQLPWKDKNDNGYDGFETRPGPIQFCSNWTQSLHDKENIFNPNIWWLNHMNWLSSQLLPMVCWWLNPKKIRRDLHSRSRSALPGFPRFFAQTNAEQRDSLEDFPRSKPLEGRVAKTRFGSNLPKKFALSYILHMFFSHTETGLNLILGTNVSAHPTKYGRVTRNHLTPSRSCKSSISSVKHLPANQIWQWKITQLHRIATLVSHLNDVWKKWKFPYMDATSSQIGAC